MIGVRNGVLEKFTPDGWDEEPGDDKVQSPVTISEGYTPDFTG